MAGTAMRGLAITNNLAMGTTGQGAARVADIRLTPTVPSASLLAADMTTICRIFVSVRTNSPCLSGSISRITGFDG
jgi:hypothetical protein